MTNIERVSLFIHRYCAARKIGIRFFGASKFVIPKFIRIRNKRVALDLPLEHGVWGAFIDLLLDDCYGLRLLVARRGSGEIRRILDVGANCGLFGVAARLAFPNAIIHCYEPNAALAPYLVNQAGIADLEVHLEAVGRETGLVSLEVDTLESVHSVSRSDLGGEIPQTSLRSALRRLGGEADLVKMDCEGAEWDILEDVAAWRRVRFLTLEYHLGDLLDHERINIAIARIGFNIDQHYKAQKHGLVFASRMGVC